MKALRTKGSSLPIKIMIKINKNNIKYFLGILETYFEKENQNEKDGIKEFLIKAKNHYINQINRNIRKR